MVVLLFLLCFALGLSVFNQQYERFFVSGLIVVLLLGGFWLDHHMTDPIILQW